MSMSMSRLIDGSSSLSTTRPSLNFTSFSYNPTSQASFSNNKDHSSYSCHGFSSRSLQYDPMKKTIPRKSFIIRNNITPPPGFLFLLDRLPVPYKVDNVVNTAEYIMETIEAVAEKVDNVIDNITDDLPENSTIRKTMEAVDELVEGVAKSAHIGNDIIDKVEEVENKLESMILKEAKEEEAPKLVVDTEEMPTQEATTKSLKAD